MARIRSTHPEQWTDDEFVTCTPLARLLALGLRNEADDNGIFEWNAAKLKIRLLPMDNCNVDELLGELIGANQVLKFEREEKNYGMIRNFQRFQSPKHPSFKYPIPSHPLPKCYALNEKYVGSVPEALPEASGKTAAKERRGEESKGEINTANSSPPNDCSERGQLFGGIPGPASSAEYLTKKGRKLTGRRLEDFEAFWTAFNLKKGRAEAADAWLDIREYTSTLVDSIVAAAQRESKRREWVLKNGQTPKMAQGWLSGRRWEDNIDADLPMAAGYPNRPTRDPLA